MLLQDSFFRRQSQPEGPVPSQPTASSPNRSCIKTVLVIVKHSKRIHSDFNSYLPCYLGAQIYLCQQERYSVWHCFPNGALLWHSLEMHVRRRERTLQRSRKGVQRSHAIWPFLTGWLRAFFPFIFCYCVQLLGSNLFSLCCENIEKNPNFLHFLFCSSGWSIEVLPLVWLIYFEFLCSLVLILLFRYVSAVSRRLFHI